MSLYDNGIRMSSREAEATLIYQESNKCNVRQMTDEEKARYGEMGTRGPKPREVRYCPGCNAQIKLSKDRLQEPVLKCFKCEGNFETDLWSKSSRTQIQGDGGAVPSTNTDNSAPVDPQPKTEPVKDLQPDKEIDSGWQAVIEAKHKAEHQAWKEEQVALKAQQPDPEVLKAAQQNNTAIRDEIMQKLTELTGLIGHLYTEGRKDGCREGYTKAMDDMTAAIRTLGVDSVMLGGGC